MKAISFVIVSCDCKHGSFTFPPLSLLLFKTVCGISKEHHVLFALDLTLQELKTGAVETQDILKTWVSKNTHAYTIISDHMRGVITVAKPILFTVLKSGLTLISRTLEIVLVRNSSMTDSSIWLLVIWPKWTLGKW